MSHPEDFCQWCGSRNPLWYANNDLFNRVIKNKAVIICPKCFQDKANKIGIKTICECRKFIKEVG